MATSKCGTAQWNIVNPSDRARAMSANKWYGATTMQTLMDKYGTSSALGDTSIIGSNINPYTGKAFTSEELELAGVGSYEDYWNNWDEYGMSKNKPYGNSSCGGSCAGGIGNAPTYGISAEQQAWQDMLSGEIGQTIAEGGRGIPEETQAAMLQSQTDALKAQEAENIRVMRNNMEKRGITNSGFTYSNEQKIRSNTTTALAKSMTDIGIQNQMMKLASYENAIGQAAQFLGYLGDETQKKYMAQLYAWQGKLDIWKAQLSANTSMSIAELQAQLSMDLAEMELEASNAQGAGQMFGSILGFIGSLLFAF